jgi:hypothetical protein
MTTDQIKAMGETAIDPKKLWMPAWVFVVVCTPAIWKIAMCAATDREWKSRTDERMTAIESSIRSTARWYPTDQQVYNGMLRERNAGLSVPTVREVVDRRIEE